LVLFLGIPFSVLSSPPVHAVNGDPPCGPLVEGIHQVSTREHLLEVGRGASTQCLLSSSYLQRADITLDSNSVWDPIGNGLTEVPFSGSYNGGGFTIDGLVIALGDQYSAMFGYTAPGSTISNVRLMSGSVTGPADIAGLVAWHEGNIINSESHLSVTATDIDGENVGGLVGWTIGIINGSFAHGDVVGFRDVGGLAGQQAGGEISHSGAYGNVSGFGRIGGLVGYKQDGEISLSFAAGNRVSASEDYIGGLVGRNDVPGSVSASYSTASVRGWADVGGLVGRNEGTIERSWASGSVIAAAGMNDEEDAGGLVGYNTVTGTISDSYSLGEVNGTDWVGGLVGYNSGVIARSYSVGIPNGVSDVGGLVGETVDGAVEDSFWNVTTTGIGASDSAVGSSGGTGKNSTQMRSIATFSADSTGLAASWSIVEGWVAPSLSSPIWGMCPEFNDGYPYLLWQATVNPCLSSPGQSAITPAERDSQCLAATGPDDLLNLRVLSLGGIVLATGSGLLLWRRRALAQHLSE
jgi:hypothetical protein